MEIFKSSAKVILVPNDEYHTIILKRKFKKKIPRRKLGSIHFFFNKEIRKWIGILYCINGGIITKEEFKHCLTNLLKITNLVSIAFSGFEKSKTDFKRSAFVSFFPEYLSRNIQIFYYPADEGERLEIQRSTENSSSFQVSKVVGKTFFGDINFPSWEPIFQDGEMLGEIERKITQRSAGKNVFPEPGLIFNVFNLKISEIKVLLLGQDPYPTKGNAMGLSFSVSRGVPPPGSLKNIYKELKSDGYKIKNKRNGDLTKWVKQGVFLLNSALTVEEGKPGSHSDIWEKFTDNVMRYMDKKCNNLVIIAMGAKAQKAVSIFSDRHKRIKIAHPSPMSCNLFFGSKPFSRTNRILKNMGRDEIDWNL